MIKLNLVMSLLQNLKKYKGIKRDQNEISVNY